MSGRTIPNRLIEHPDAWYFGRATRRQYEAVFPMPAPQPGETLSAYLERRYEALRRTGMSPGAVALSLRVEAKRAGNEAAADAVLAWRARPNEREGR